MHAISSRMQDLAGASVAGQYMHKCGIHELSTHVDRLCSCIMRERMHTQPCEKESRALTWPSEDSSWAVRVAEA